jgi:predicted O-methyltransferase YrrM
MNANIMLALVACLLGVGLYSLHKLRKVHLMLYSMQAKAQQDANAHYRQQELLFGLYIDLGLTKSLPGTRDWAASPDFLAELVRHALSAKPRTVVECSSGTSTVVLARCMQMNGGGKVYSLEHDPVYARQTRDQLSRHGLSEFAEVVDAPLQAMALDGADWTWYATGALPASLEIDMIAIDGPPKTTGPLARYPAGPVLFPQLAPQAAVFLDDSDRPDETAILQRWRQEFPTLAQSKRFCEKGCAVLAREVPAQAAA